jgi:imidazolonepropionase-like amidohydrolase
VPNAFAGAGGALSEEDALLRTAHNGVGMKGSGCAALLLLTAFACRSADKPPDPAAGTTVLQGGTLINPDAEPVPNALIVIQEGRITCAGTGAACTYPAGAKTVDLTGAYVGPGLIDAHVHYSQTGWLDGRPDAATLRHQYPYDSVVRALEAHPEHFHRAALCSGVTSVFDVGGFRWTFDLARKTRSSTDAPLVVAAGPLISTIPLPPEMMDVLVVMKDDSTVRAAVRDHQRRGAEAIKVWYVQVPDSMRKHAKAMLMVAADETRKAGLRLLVHALEPPGVRDAVEAGAAVLVHDVFTGPVDRPLLEAIKRSGAIVIPTLSVLDGYSDAFQGKSPASRYPLECVDSATRRKLGTVVPDSLLDKQSAAFWRGPAKALRPIASANLKLMHQAGIPIAMGTDAGNPGTVHGPSVYSEMEAMQRAGMSAADVFASATIVAARAMALDTMIGSVEPGKRADLVVFDADPTADIRNARQVRMVIHSGVVRTRKELLPP